MKTTKKKYYALDDVHEMVSNKLPEKSTTEINKLTRDFFAKRRVQIPKKTIKSKV